MLSERMRATLPDITWSVSRVNATIHLWADEVAQLEARVAELEAILDGDPNQTASPEERHAWRQSAIRYSDKVEAEFQRLVRYAKAEALLVRHKTVQNVLARDEAYQDLSPETRRRIEDAE